MANPIRVLVVDDHKMVRGGLKAFLLAYDDLELVGEAADGEEALHKCAETTPDVVLMDLVMPGIDGPAATRAIRDAQPEVRVIALTSFPEEELVEQALQAGAISYLLKTVEPDELANAIRAAFRGQTTLAPEAAQALIQAHTRPPQLGHDLTERERDVLALLVRGLTNQEIAQHLAVSANTAKFHVSNVLAKLGATSRTEAVALALEHHLLDR